MNIVIFTKNWIGDVIFETPAIRAIKENFPKAYLIAITPRHCVEILQVNPYIDEVIPFDAREEEKGLIAIWHFIRRLKKQPIEQAYLFHRAQKHAWIAFLAGAKKRIGYRTKGRRFILTQAIEEPEGPIHDVQYFLDLLRSAGLKIQGEYPYEFFYSPEDETKVRSWFEEYGLSSSKLVALNAGANWLPKRWPPEYFQDLAHRLVEKYGVQIILTGSKEDESTVRTIMGSRNGSNMVSFCGKTTIRELGALFSKCRLVVSNDSGPLHIATGVGTNVVGLFGPTQPLETAPLGRGRNVVVHYAPEGMKLPWIGKNFPSPWMESIRVEEVLRVIEREGLL